MISNKTNQMLKEAEESKAISFGGGSFDFDKLYPKLILKEDNPSHVSALTDLLRMIKLTVHFDKDKKCFSLCDEIHYKRDCKLCAACKVKTDKNDKTTLKPFPVQIRCGFFWDHSRGETKTAESGKEYTEENIAVAEIRAGEGEKNFAALRELNGSFYDEAKEEFPYEDVFSFYKEVGDDWVLQPQLLKYCGLMFENNGKNKVLQLIKSSNKKEGQEKKSKVSYDPPKYIERAKAKRNLDKDPVVPQEVYDHFNKQTAADLLPFILSYYGNVDWEMWGVEPPKEGQKFTIGKQIIDGNAVL